MINKVLILGAGTMGLQIGCVCAAAGFDVTIFDVQERALADAGARLDKVIRSLARHGRMEADGADPVISRIRFTGDAASAGAGADIVNESVPEDPEMKRRVFARFNDCCPDHTIFTTNSSTLVPSMIADATGRPDRFCALHFHDCSLTNVVDVMPHPGTSPETLAAVLAFCRDIRQFPIELKKEQPGYVFNTMLTEWMSAALSLASKEVAEPRDIDRAWMGIMKTPAGPFGIMDSIGLETAYKVTDYWARKKQDKRRLENARFLKSYVDRGDLGVKTGKGFYRYPDPEFLKPEFMEGID